MFSLSNVTCWTALALKYSNCFAGKKKTCMEMICVFTDIF